MKYPYLIPGIDDNMYDLSPAQRDARRRRGQSILERGWISEEDDMDERVRWLRSQQPYRQNDNHDKQ